MKNMLKFYTLDTVVEKPVNIGSYVGHSNEVSPNNSNSLRRLQDISTLDFSTPSNFLTLRQKLPQINLQILSRYCTAYNECIDLCIRTL